MKKTPFALLFAFATIAALLVGCGSNGAHSTNGASSEVIVEGSAPIIADGLVDINVEGETDLPGNFYLSFVYSRNIIMLDGKGNIVWSKHEEQPFEGANTGWWDFKKHVVDGETYYSYHDQTGAYDNYGLEGYAPGERVILDEDFNEIKRITFESSDTVAKGDPLDGHDFLMIDLNHYILSGYIHDTVFNVPGYPDGSQVVYSYLQEVKDGEVVWEVKSTDYPELYALTVTDGTPTAADYANEQTNVPDIIHFNSMRLDDDGNLVCSFRHLSTILCLDRTKNDNQILWKLSGAADEFGLTEDEKSSCQHYATIEGNRITVFDNGNKNGLSRVITWQMDASGKGIQLVDVHSFNGKFSRACGSVQHVTGSIYVVGWGAATTDNEYMSVIDFSTGEKLLSVTQDDPLKFMYRSVYYE